MISFRDKADGFLAADDVGNASDDGFVRGANVKWPFPSFRRISLRSFAAATASVFSSMKAPLKMSRSPSLSTSAKTAR